MRLLGRVRTERTPQCAPDDPVGAGGNAEDRRIERIQRELGKPVRAADRQRVAVEQHDPRDAARMDERVVGRDRGAEGMSDDERAHKVQSAAYGTHELDPARERVWAAAKRVAERRQIESDDTVPPSE